jgi:Type VI secretion system, VipA, VC_A0107 or Hcp2
MSGRFGVIAAMARSDWAAPPCCAGVTPQTVPKNRREQLEPLRMLLESRERLEHLMNKMDGNDRLEQILQDVVRDTDALKRLQGETGRGGVTGEEK